MTLGFIHLLVFFAVAGAVFIAARSARFGFLRGTVPSLMRCIWLGALFSVFFPKAEEVILPPVVKSTTVHVLLDDSLSMSSNRQGGSSYLELGTGLVERLSKLCPSYNCNVESVRLSELAPGEVRRNFTPLKREAERFVLAGKRDHWVIVSDGGDMQPERPWSAEFAARAPAAASRGSAGSGRDRGHGLVVGFEGEGTGNYWIENVVMPPFAFEFRDFEAEVTVARSGDLSRGETLQVQIQSGNGVLAATNLKLKPGDQSVTASIPLSPLSRGFHFISVQALPVVGEKYIWDNRRHLSIDVLPDTVGILHLLGSPSWDGRYVRRYLKSEPKYDLISFFILRDPTDSQKVSERELSLIPFPVERLFTEELPNFRMVIIQNFAMHQFLLPEYQKNLVDFVKNGGALLFIGGSRALFPADVEDTPLREILPFDLKAESGTTGKGPGLLSRRLSTSPYSLDAGNGPAFDPSARFEIGLAAPSWEKRALAGVYDDWARLIGQLPAGMEFMGRHRMEWTDIKDEDVTPLLVARNAGGEAPLALASYPGKGRAIWLFTDSLWQLAAAGGEDTSSQNHYNILHAGMSWLLRQELVAPLVASRFEVSARPEGGIAFSVKLDGQAVRYFESNQAWTMTACGANVPIDQINFNRFSDTAMTLSGSVNAPVEPGGRCDFLIKGVNKAFGSVEARSANVLAAEFDDSQIAAVPAVLRELGKLSGASVAFYGDGIDQTVEKWLAEATGNEGVSSPSRRKVELQHFWLLDSWLLALVLAALVLDVVFFRWRELSGRDG